MSGGHLLAASFGGSALAALALGALALFVFPKIGLLDRPQQYGHARPPVPYPFGLVPVLVCLGGFAWAAGADAKTLALCGAAGLLLVVSFWDDRFGSPPWLRLLTQLAAAGVVIAAGIRIDFLGNPFGQTLELAAVWALLPALITAVWLLGCANASNFFDGVPGASLAACGVAGGSLALLSAGLGDAQTALLASILAGACAGAFFYNLPLFSGVPRALLGDSGAVPLGFLVAGLAVFSGGKMATAGLVLAIPLLDAVDVTIRRLFAGVSPLRGADGRHLHDRLRRAGLRDIWILALYLAAGFLLARGALALQNTSSKLMLALGVVAAFFVLSQLLDWRIANQAASPPPPRPRGLRVMMIGVGPLPTSGLGGAGALRAAAFWSALSFAASPTRVGGSGGAKDPTVQELRGVLICPKDAPPLPPEKGSAAAARSLGNRGSLIHLPKNKPLLRWRLAQQIWQFSPDCLVAVHPEIAALACSAAPPRLPIWADMNGWLPAEAAAQEHSTGAKTAARLCHLERTALRRANAISTVSMPQAHATAGELAMLGRLGDRNAAHPFGEVAVIQNPCLPIKKPGILPAPLKNLPKRAPLLVHIGGFNAWGDEALLFEAAKRFLQRHSGGRVAICGAEIAGVDDHSFGRFSARVAALPAALRSRFHLLGHLPAPQLLAVLARATVGICADKPGIEQTFGARNRINTFLAAGVPVLATAGSDIAAHVARAGAGFALPPGKPAAFAKALEDILKSRPRFAKNAKQLATSYSPQHICQPLLHWLAEGAPPRIPPALSFGDRLIEAFSLARGYLQRHGLAAAALRVVRGG